MDHSIYDRRGYPVVDVRAGYGEWVRTYEQTVLDEMDRRLAEAPLLGRHRCRRHHAGVPISFAMVWRADG